MKLTNKSPLRWKDLARTLWQSSIFWTFLLSYFGCVPIDACVLEAYAAIALSPRPGGNHYAETLWGWYDMDDCGNRAKVIGTTITKEIAG